MGKSEPVDRPDPSPPDGVRSRAVARIVQVRSEYTSARLILSNLEHRLAGTRFDRPPGYLPAEVDYISGDGIGSRLEVRDYDVRHLDRISAEEAIDYLALILEARRGNRPAGEELRRRTLDTHRVIAARFKGALLTETENIIPYTSDRNYAEAHLSNKGSILLGLTGHGFATADFCLLAATAYHSPPEKLKEDVRAVIRNLEVLSGRRLGDSANPLLIAMRSALPEYLPGFMPTYLNVGLIPKIIPGLPIRYGPEGALRILLSNRKTILEALDPEAFRDLEKEIHPRLTAAENAELVSAIESLIAKHDPGLLSNAEEQVFFFLSKIYRYYENHLDALRNFMVREIHFPSVIFQRMVCSVIDRESYAGVLYSRHPRLGRGVFLQFARTIYGEDLMTGRLPAEERHFKSREEALEEFPAVYHFWNRLFQLERLFRAPVMVEFTGVHGTFTILQVNPAELTGAGMITAVMDMHGSGAISRERVVELVKPYHVRQIESDAIDPQSLRSLTPFCQGLSVLPRTAVSGKICFAGDTAERPGEGRKDNAVLVKVRFTPKDAIDMQKVSAICSLSPAAIHVVTAAQNLGIPALLNLEESGVKLDLAGRRLINRDGLAVQEGDWVTVSSRNKTLYIGKAVFAPARLLRFMAGENVPLTPDERPRFESLASTYRDYKKLLESIGVSAFESLQDLGHSALYGRCQKDPGLAAGLANRSFDVNRKAMAARLLDVTLGTHLMNLTAFRLLTPERQCGLLKDVLVICREKRVSGYRAGAFVIGSFIRPEAPVSFWKAFSPADIGAMINEWVLHQKYLDLLNTIGEQKVNRARVFLLSQGLGSLRVHKGLVKGFMALKLSRIDLAEVRRSLPPDTDPQTAEVLEMLARPYGEFFDFGNPRSLGRLLRISEAEGLPLPGPEET
jgi:hypothetical protein